MATEAFARERQAMADFRRCLCCKAIIDAAQGFFELTGQPGGASAGQFYTLCSIQCVEHFARGVPHDG